MPLAPIPESKNFWTAADCINRGMVRFAHGDFKGAIADYSKAIKLEPTYAEAWYNRGYMKVFAEDNEGAVTDYSRAIDLGLTVAA